ncbi:MAG: ABC transporter permease [Bacteroidia bacterium]|nr:ABC transporter permease [Bacteroidia bacterium]NND24973.1 ABC transporter permease [Flavobacteriaceae bacterium]MBT8278607.1 ABC transporter permease [Bacteroidia bacterium]NNK59499.1 ABC transporter permease [Flavobacteriaceae bacterium]NNL32633.1 ABC transporter permease [Flavobacteriaceae bacterium]
MFDLDLWREILQSMNKNRTRSILSGLTVAFAIMLFTILFGIVNGLVNTFEEAFVDDATNAMFIYSGNTTKAHKGLQAGRRIQFKNEDFDYINEDFEDKVQYSTARLYRNVNASFRGEKNSYSLRAVHPDHQYLEKTLIKEGRYISQNDLKNKTKVVVIGRLVEEDLFLKTKALGKYVNLSGIQYKIVGIFTDDGGDNEERLIYMPITTAQQVYGNNDYIDQINITYKPELGIDQAIDFGLDLEKKLKNRFSVAPTDQRAVRVMNMAQQTKGVNQFTGVLSLLVLVIGLGTLIAGIVGISNIMIFIVKERTKEIGIRKALGATPRSIVSIIILESVVVTALAGYLGLLVGVGVLSWVGPGLEEYFITNPGVKTQIVFSATVVLVIAGALAGYVPAKRASKIKPIVALRND